MKTPTATICFLAATSLVAAAPADFLVARAANTNAITNVTTNAATNTTTVVFANGTTVDLDQDSIITTALGSIGKLFSGKKGIIGTVLGAIGLGGGALALSSGSGSSSAVTKRFAEPTPFAVPSSVQLDVKPTGL